MKIVSNRDVTDYAAYKGNMCQQDSPGHEQRILEHRKRVFEDMPGEEFAEWVKRRRIDSRQARKRQGKPVPVALCAAGCGRVASKIGYCPVCYCQVWKARRRLREMEIKCDHINRVK